MFVERSEGHEGKQKQMYSVTAATSACDIIYQLSSDVDILQIYIFLNTFPLSVYYYSLIVTGGRNCLSLYEHKDLVM